LAEWRRDSFGHEAVAPAFHSWEAEGMGRSLIKRLAQVVRPVSEGATLQLPQVELRL
jgi:hypothetical protein